MVYLPNYILHKNNNELKVHTAISMTHKQVNKTRHKRIQNAFCKVQNLSMNNILLMQSIKIDQCH